MRLANLHRPFVLDKTFVSPVHKNAPKLEFECRIAYGTPRFYPATRFTTESMRMFNNSNNTISPEQIEKIISNGMYNVTLTTTID